MSAIPMGKPCDQSRGQEPGVEFVLSECFGPPEKIHACRNCGGAFHDACRLKYTSSIDLLREQGVCGEHGCQERYQDNETQDPNGKAHDDDDDMYSQGCEEDDVADREVAADKTQSGQANGQANILVLETQESDNVCQAELCPRDHQKADLEDEPEDNGPKEKNWRGSALSSRGTERRATLARLLIPIACDLQQNTVECHGNMFRKGVKGASLKALKICVAVHYTAGPTSRRAWGLAPESDIEHQGAWHPTYRLPASASDNTPVV